MKITAQYILSQYRYTIWLKFSISCGLGIPLAVEFLNGSFNVSSGSHIWENIWPIITLSNSSIALIKDHRCLLRNNGTTASFALTATPEHLICFYWTQIWSCWSWWLVLRGTLYLLMVQVLAQSTNYWKQKHIMTSLYSIVCFTAAITMQPRIPLFLQVVEAVFAWIAVSPDNVSCTPRSIRLWWLSTFRLAHPRLCR
jgi:hypothetical protein